MKLPYKFRWLGILNSPFKKPQISFYFGKIERGTPYFLPRKWVKLTRAEAVKKATESVNDKKLVKKSFEDWYESYKNYSKPVPLKFGFQIISLGWKTKFDSTRHEWNPMISFVGFGKQFCIYVGYKNKKDSDTFLTNTCYWEAWLTYAYYTDKSKSKIERLKETVKQYSATWSDNESSTNYYNYILKSKYLKQIEL
jgi:hypothetical protein